MPDESVSRAHAAIVHGSPADSGRDGGDGDDSEAPLHLIDLGSTKGGCA